MPSKLEPRRSRLRRSGQSGRRDSNPRRSAWKADALPTELLPQNTGGLGSPPVETIGWRVMDSNHRRQCRQIYSLLPLATRATLRSLVTSMLHTFRDFSRTHYRGDRSASGVFGVEECECGHSLETRGLAMGIEPTTACLQNRCSTVELRQRVQRFGNGYVRDRGPQRPCHASRGCGDLALAPDGVKPTARASRATSLSAGGALTPKRAEAPWALATAALDRAAR